MARYRFFVRQGDPDWYMRGWRATMDPRLRIAGECQFGTPLLVMLGALLNREYLFGLVIVPFLAGSSSEVSRSGSIRARLHGGPLYP